MNETFRESNVNSWLTPSYYFQVSETEYGWILSEPVETLWNPPLLVGETTPRILLLASLPRTDLGPSIHQAALTGVDTKTKMISTCEFFFPVSTSTIACEMFIHSIVHIFVWWPIRETIQKDMEIWEGSGQWPLSCYSVLKGSISGLCINGWTAMLSTVGYTMVLPDSDYLYFLVAHTSLLVCLQGLWNFHRMSSGWNIIMEEHLEISRPT